MCLFFQYEVITTTSVSITRPLITSHVNSSVSFSSNPSTMRNFNAGIFLTAMHIADKFKDAHRSKLIWNLVKCLNWFSPILFMKRVSKILACEIYRCSNFGSAKKDETSIVPKLMAPTDKRIFVNEVKFQEVRQCLWYYSIKRILFKINNIYLYCLKNMLTKFEHPEIPTSFKEFRSRNGIKFQDFTAVPFQVLAVELVC